MNTTPAPERPIGRSANNYWPPITVAVIGTALAVLLGFATTRGDNILGNDSFGYVRESQRLWLNLPRMPTNLGGLWPRGYPLLGALLSSFSLHAYDALQAISIASLFIILLISAQTLKETSPHALPLLFCIPMVPGVHQYAVSPMSEMTFAALAAIAIYAMGRSSSNKKWLHIALAAAVASLTIRYIGIALILGTTLWTTFRTTTPDPRHSRIRTWAVPAAYCILALSLLYTNFRATGHATGGERPFPEGEGPNVLKPFCDFGLSFLALAASGPVQAIKASTLNTIVVGGSITAGLSLTALRAVTSPSDRFQGPAGMVVLSYASALIYARITSHFDDLSSARFAIPLIAPLYLLFANRMRPCAPFTRFSVLSASALIAGISASRGISKATHGDITEALQHFREHPAEPSTIFVNDPGISLAAYLSAKVERIRADHPTDMKGQDGDYIVLVPRRLDRSGNRIEWGHQMLNQANELAALGRAAVVLKSHKTLILRLRKLTPKQATTPPR